MRTPHLRAEKPELLIVDSKRLRQAGFMRLLETWADAMGLTLKAVVPDALLDMCCVPAKCELIIISIGSASVEEEHQALIESVHRLMPQAPLVIISDREDPQEVWAAFQEGAVGFIPTSIEPALAFQALSFIRSGGAYFPPSILSTRLREVTANGVDRASDPTDRASDLTAKQEEVFDLLRQGYSSKTIARQLRMSEGTVKVHVRRIIHKFGVANRTQVAVATMNQGSLRVAANEDKELGKNGNDNMTQLSAF